MKTNARARKKNIVANCYVHHPVAGSALHQKPRLLLLTWFVQRDNRVHHQRGEEHSGLTCRIQGHWWNRSGGICLWHSLLTAATWSAVEPAGPDLCDCQRAKLTLDWAPQGQKTRSPDGVFRVICKMTSLCSCLQLAHKSSRRPSTFDLPDSHFRFDIMRSQDEFEIVVSWSVVADVRRDRN